MGGAIAGLGGGSARSGGAGGPRKSSLGLTMMTDGRDGGLGGGEAWVGGFDCAPADVAAPANSSATKTVRVRVMACSSCCGTNRYMGTHAAGEKPRQTRSDGACGHSRTNRLGRRARPEEFRRQRFEDLIRTLAALSPGSLLPEE